MEKTHWKKAFDKNFLGSHDLDEGKDLVAVIDHIEVRKVKNNQGEEASKNVAVFKGKIKPMILNVTNCKIIKRFSGSNYIEDWGDIPVTIYIKNVTAFGEEVEALRIREKQPIMEKPKLTPMHPSWPKAVDYLRGDGNTLQKILESWEMTEEDIEKIQEEAIS
jgi:hypothetical protein